MTLLPLLNAPSHVQSSGSAKKLSKFRAETIYSFLVRKGIDPSRIEIKGWGGNKMLYDKHDSRANLNVRVEVEITAN